MDEEIDEASLDNSIIKEDNMLGHEKYSSLVNSLKGYEEFLLNEGGIIISTNLEVVTITGYEEFEVIGKHFDIFYPTEEKKQASQDLKRAMRLNEIVVSGLRLKKRATTFWAKTKITYISKKYNLTIPAKVYHSFRRKVYHFNIHRTR